MKEIQENICKKKQEKEECAKAIKRTIINTDEVNEIEKTQIDEYNKTLYDSKKNIYCMYKGTLCDDVKKEIGDDIKTLSNMKYIENLSIGKKDFVCECKQLNRTLFNIYAKTSIKIPKHVYELLKIQSPSENAKTLLEGGIDGLSDLHKSKTKFMLLFTQFLRCKSVQHIDKKEICEKIRKYITDNKSYIRSGNINSCKNDINTIIETICNTVGRKNKDAIDPALIFKGRFSHGTENACTKMSDEYLKLCDEHSESHSKLLNNHEILKRLQQGEKKTADTNKSEKDAIQISEPIPK